MRQLFPLSLAFLIGCSQLTPGSATDSGEPADGGTFDAGTIDAGPLPGLDPAEGITKYCHDTHQAICEGIVSCSCPLDFRGEVESCTAQRASACEDRLKGLIPLMQQGDVKITAQSITDCVAGLKAIGDECTDIEKKMPLACAGYWMDTASIGESCRGPSQFHLCADGLGGCDNSTDAYLCQPLPSEGKACAGGEACAPGLLCLSHRTCVRVGSIGWDCSEPVACNPGLTCGSDWKCTEPYAENQPCDRSWQCAENLECKEGTCQPTRPLGAACEYENDCGAWHVCVGSLTFRHCAAKAVENDFCHSTEECADGLGCDQYYQKCVPLPGLDDDCLNYQLCADGLACDENDRKCVTPPGQGEPCLIGNALCADGLACDANNVCQPPPSNDGDECAQPGNRCGAGLACDFTATGSYCHTRRGVGGDCQNDVICLDGLHCDFDTLKCAEPFPLDAPCRLGNECGLGRECTRRGGEGYRCRELPSSLGDGCELDCGGGLACRGAGGECAQAICATR